jgi:hypothetical protein
VASVPTAAVFAITRKKPYKVAALPYHHRPTSRNPIE